MCPHGCDLCDITDRDVCHKCTRPRYSHEGVCVDKCPSGWHPNWPDGDGRACRPWRLGDAGTAPYPFLIMLAILWIICAFGMMKRRAILYKNKMKWTYPQRMITCMIICVAPLQFLATIAQWVFAYIYGTQIFAILALIVTAAALIINIVFQCHFLKRFDSRRLPMEWERRVRLGKKKRSEVQKYVEPIDLEFNKYKKLHRCTVYFIYVLSVCMNFKFNMSFYSFFYDQRMF